MNLRGRSHFAYITLRGSALPAHYRSILAEDALETAPETRRHLLAQMLRHCRDHVPHYADILRDLPEPETDPEGVLARMPILDKPTIRARFEALKSDDLARRTWHLNTSGGSTGEPARFIQDREYDDRTGAIALAFSRWAGCELGEPEVRLWGSEREVLEGTRGWREKTMRWLAGTTFFNAFRMTPEVMRGFVATLHRIRPKLIVAYAQALYEFAGFLESEKLDVPPIGAVITSAGTLHDFMRTRIQRVFQCPVYNRYGSREVGLIASERPGVEGLWVPPWGVLVEVVDEAGKPARPGEDGEILVTSLANHSMPLLRYRIGDRGAFAPGEVRGCKVLSRVSGRNVDVFRKRDGTLIDGEFFTHLLYFREWVDKFQFIQTEYEKVVLRVVPRTRDLARIQPELDGIASAVKAALGPGALLEVEWVDEIPAAASGKFRYTISELQPP